MKPKTILTLLAVAAAAALLALALARSSESKLKAALPEKPFAKVQINDSESVSIRDAKGLVLLVKSGDIWTLPSRAGYPADFARLSSFLNELAELKPVQAIPGGEAALERFDLLAPDAKNPSGSGLNIQVQGKGGAPLLSLRRGKVAKQVELSDEERQMAAMMGRDPSASGPRFAFLPESNAVVVIASPLGEASVKATDWLDKEFPKPSGQLKSVSLLDAGSLAWRIKRGAPASEWLFEGKAPAGQDFDKAAAEALSSSASWISFSDVAGRIGAKPEHGLAQPRTFELQDFDGFTFKFDIGEADGAGRLFTTLSVSFAAPARIAPKDEKPEDAKKAEEAFAKSVADSKAKAEKWSKRVSSWVYLVEKRGLDQLLVDANKLFKAKPEAALKAPSLNAKPALPKPSAQIDLKPSVK